VQKLDALRAGTPLRLELAITGNGEMRIVVKGLTKDHRSFEVSGQVLMFEAVELVRSLFATSDKLREESIV